jgi:glycosyltransferase involved in cell wall biosynthesis
VKMKVVFFHRKKYLGVYSIEILFEQIRKSLPPEIVSIQKELRFISRGFLKRLYISIEAAFCQGDINHVTGDINFIASFLKAKRTVLTVHDVGYMLHNSALARFLLLWFWIRLPVRKCAIVTTVSESTKIELLKYVKVDPQKIRVVNVPISDSFSYVPRNFNKVKPVILQIGTKENKNLLRLIKAIKGISCKLEIVGSISDEQKQELVHNGVIYEVSANLTEDEIISKYASCDLVSFVSTYEGFGMPIVEANAMGRVVVTSKILSMPEVGANAAHYVDPFDIDSIRAGIIRVIDDDEYRERLIANGFINRNRFDSKNIANQYLEIYKYLAGKAKLNDFDDLLPN